jgi:hypothetical protein
MLSIVVIAICCKEKQQFSNESVTSLKSVASKPQQISDMLQSFKFIQLETTDQSLIGGHIGKIKKIANKYFISSDRKELLVFDSTGLFIKKIGRIGQGPGEYSSISDYDVFENGNIAILNVNKLLLYDKYGTYIKTVPLNITGSNIKIINEDRILLYSSGEKYVIYEFNISGKIISKEIETLQSTRLGRNIAFIIYGHNEVITQIGRSNDFIFYNSNYNKFSFRKLLSDNILTASREESIIKNNGLMYLNAFPDLKFIDGVAGCNTHLLFACGSSNDGFSVQILNVDERKIQHAISKNDINDVTFTSPFFMEYACLSEAKDCFITYVYHGDIHTGLEEHNEFRENPNYRKFEEFYRKKNEKEIQEENPLLVEFVFY